MSKFFGMTAVSNCVHPEYYMSGCKCLSSFETLTETLAVGLIIIIIEMLV